MTPSDGDDIHLDDAVAGQPVGPVEDPEATALGQPGQADRRAGAGRQAAAVRGQRRVDVDQLCARADGRGGRRRVVAD